MWFLTGAILLEMCVLISLEKLSLRQELDTAVLFWEVILWNSSGKTETGKKKKPTQGSFQVDHYDRKTSLVSTRETLRISIQIISELSTPRTKEIVFRSQDLLVKGCTVRSKSQNKKPGIHDSAKQTVIMSCLHSAGFCSHS